MRQNSINISLEGSNMHGNAYRIDIWSKIERTLMQSFLELQIGFLSFFFFFSQPSTTTLEATMIISTQNSSILSGVVHWLFLSLHTPLLLGFFQGTVSYIPAVSESYRHMTGLKLRSDWMCKILRRSSTGPHFLPKATRPYALLARVGFWGRDYC